MAALPLSCGFGLSIAFFAQVAPGPPIEWGNLTALGIVAVVIIFIVTRMLPDLHKKFVEQSVVFSATVKEIQADFTTTVKEIQADFVRSIDKIHERTEKWEVARHEDLIQLTRAVTLLTTQCAAHMGGMLLAKKDNALRQIEKTEEKG
jgi:hypothetical protein